MGKMDKAGHCVKGFSIQNKNNSTNDIENDMNLEFTNSYQLFFGFKSYRFLKSKLFAKNITIDFQSQHFLTDYRLSLFLKTSIWKLLK